MAAAAARSAPQRPLREVPHFRRRAQPRPPTHVFYPMSTPVSAFPQQQMVQILPGTMNAGGRHPKHNPFTSLNVRECVSTFGKKAQAAALRKLGERCDDETLRPAELDMMYRMGLSLMRQVAGAAAAPAVNQVVAGPIGTGAVIDTVRSAFPDHAKCEWKLFNSWAARESEDLRLKLGMATLSEFQSRKLFKDDTGSTVEMTANPRDERKAPAPASAKTVLLLGSTVCANKSVAKDARSEAINSGGEEQKMKAAAVQAQTQWIAVTKEALAIAIETVRKGGENSVAVLHVRLSPEELCEHTHDVTDAAMSQLHTLVDAETKAMTAEDLKNKKKDKDAKSGVVQTVVLSDYFGVSNSKPTDFYVFVLRSRFALENAIREIIKPVLVNCMKHLYGKQLLAENAKYTKTAVVTDRFKRIKSCFECATKALRQAWLFGFVSKNVVISSVHAVQLVSQDIEVSEVLALFGQSQQDFDAGAATEEEPAEAETEADADADADDQN